MSKREQLEYVHTKTEEDELPPEPIRRTVGNQALQDASEKAGEMVDDIDELLLDIIDDMTDEEAEMFVQAYAQMNGQ